MLAYNEDGKMAGVLIIWNLDILHRQNENVKHTYDKQRQNMSSSHCFRPQIKTEINQSIVNTLF